MEIFDILGAAFPPPGAIEVKFCTAKRTQVPVGPAKFGVNRCNESPLRGENPDFWPVSKFNTGSLPLRGILQVITLTHCNAIVKIPNFRPQLLPPAKSRPGRPPSRSPPSPLRAATVNNCKVIDKSNIVSLASVW